MLHRLRKRSETAKFRRLFDVCKRRSDLCRRSFVPRFQPLAGVYRWGRHAVGRVSYFYRSNGRSNPLQTKQGRSAISAVMFYDLRFRRPQKRPLKLPLFFRVSKRNIHVKQPLRLPKTWKRDAPKLTFNYRKPCKNAGKWRYMYPLNDTLFTNFNRLFLYNRLKNSGNRSSCRCLLFEKSAREHFYPIVLNLTLAFTNASARIESAGISFGEWCGLWLTSRTKRSSSALCMYLMVM